MQFHYCINRDCVPPWNVGGATILLSGKGWAKVHQYCIVYILVTASFYIKEWRCWTMLSSPCCLRKKPDAIYLFWAISTRMCWTQKAGFGKENEETTRNRHVSFLGKISLKNGNCSHIIPNWTIPLAKWQTIFAIFSLLLLKARTVQFTTG
jgi:hypothetical protein